MTAQDWQDAMRERRIAVLRRRMLEAASVDERLEFWRRMRDEIRDRSPAQVERMEIERGLR